MKHTTIKSYQDAKEYLQGKKSRPYAHNTRITIDSLDLGHEVITVTYHDNPIVNFYPDGVASFSSCGWKTPTTKERINWFLPDGFSLYQEKSVWHVVKHGTSYNYINYVFADGLAIDKFGNVYNDAPADNIKDTIKAIKKFVDGYIKALLSGEMDSPSGGDCWYCLMENEQGKNLGELTSNNEHILSHFEESYYVPSMLLNAYKFNKRLSQFTMNAVYTLWSGSKVSEWESSLVARDVKSCLTAYLKHLLGIAQ